MVKSHLCVSYGSLKRFPHTFTIISYYTAILKFWIFFPDYIVTSFFQTFTLVSGRSNCPSIIYSSPAISKADKKYLYFSQTPVNENSPLCPIELVHPLFHTVLK